MTDSVEGEISDNTSDGVLTDNVDAARPLRVRSSDPEAVALILDRLSGEITAAADMLRGNDHAPATGAAAARPSCDPWSIIDLVTHDLSRRGIKSRFGAETDLGAAAQSAARLLEALGLYPVVPDDDDSVV